MYDPTVCDIVVRTAKGFLQIYLVRMTEMEPWYPALLGLAEQYRYVCSTYRIQFSVADLDPHGSRNFACILIRNEKNSKPDSVPE